MAPYYAWSDEDDAHFGGPRPVVYIENLRVKPMGDGNLRVLLVDHPTHAAAWDAFEEHGLSREVALILDGETYYYYAEVGDEEDPVVIYLFPLPDSNETLPKNRRFLEKAVNLKLRW